MQLSFEFPEPLNLIQLKRANILLRSLNEGMKGKEVFKPICVFTEKEYDVYVCGRPIENDKIDMLFNVLDGSGNFPKGFSANWRNYEHIKQELGLK